MRVYVDADACPVVKIIEEIAARYELQVTLLCDTNHVLESDYSEVMVVGAGADAVDFKLVSLLRKGEPDIVVTQDYGVAAMVLGKDSFCIHQSGKWYTNESIDLMLFQRHLSKKARRQDPHMHGKGPKKRTTEDDVKFAKSFEMMIRKACNIE